jgi:hypothetical protein
LTRSDRRATPMPVGALDLVLGDDAAVGFAGAI